MIKNKLNVKIKQLLCISFILFFYLSEAQVTNEGQPKSWKLDLESSKAHSMPSFDLKSLQKEDEINDKKENQPYRFGHEHNVSLGFKEGKWNRLKNGDKIWLLNIKSEGAKTLNFIFDEFHIPDGAKLYFYNNDKSDLLGAYTSSQNRDDMQFGTWLINGDDVWVEYYEPATARFDGQLHISKVVHGYRSVADIADLSKALNDSGPCNQDVDCPVGADFDSKKDDLKKAVALVLTGSSFCSGSLINNTNNDLKQYFLTADHCLGSSLSNWSFRFNWRSPNPSCATTTNSTNGNFNQTLSGATLKANSAKSDFALLEIDAPLPTNWDLIWAGWDRSGDIPDFTVGIHHPNGDIMKVSRDNDSPSKNTRPFGDTENLDNWFLDEWELGVTEPGSSGSPLFDQNGKIIGQLAGGAAACDGTSNNGAFDYYGRFDVSWDFGSKASSRLKDWLDPGNTGVSTLDQYPLSQVLNNDVAIRVENVDGQICGEEAFPVISLQNRGNNTITSVTLTYQLGSQTPQTVQWTGSLAYLETDEIASPVFQLDSDILFSASIEINGAQDEFIGDNSFAKTLDNYQDDTYTTETITLTLKTDRFPEENSWQFYDQNGNLIRQSSDLLEETTYTEVFEVEPGKCYEFVILDSFGDGICCEYGEGFYRLRTDSRQTINENAEFGSIDVTTFKIAPLLSSEDFNISEFTVYPNPTKSFITIESQLDKELNLNVFDIRGKQIYVGKMNGKSSIDFNAFSSGVYLLKIDDGNQSVTKKIVKQ